jgi:hypothetical protein
VAVDVEEDVVVVVELGEVETVCAQGVTWEAVLIDGNAEEEEDGVLTVGAGAGVDVELEVDGTLIVDPPNGEGVVGVAAGVVLLGGTTGATCAPAFIVDANRAMPATAPRRAHRFVEANSDRRGIIAGDP